MPANAHIDLALRPEDVAALGELMRRSVNELNMDVRDVLEWGGHYITRSVGASTKVAPHLRPIVRNPDTRYKTDARRAPFGVMRYKSDGTQYFQPIYRTGEFGKQRFFDKNTMAWYDRSSGSGQWRKLPSGPDLANPEMVVPGIMTDRRRKIGRRGLAKNNWKWMQTNLRNSGTGGVMGVQNTAGVKWQKDGNITSLTLTNFLRYAASALRHGGSAGVELAGARAFSAMRNRFEKRLEKMKSKGWA